MAIGNNNNPNLFGTDYNSEEEKRKQAELAAQGAMMGAGGVPAAAVGQTPGVNPFSLKKRNPKFGSGETLYRGATGMEDIAGIQGVPQGGTLDPTQGARDLLIGRQFNRGEPIRISDMGSLIQAPQEVPQSAFGQAPAVSPFSMEAAGQVNPMMQPQSLEVTPQALPKPTPTDIIGTFDNPESPQVNSAQANFLARKEEGGSLTVKELKDAEAFAASMGTTFNRITGYSREAFQAAQDAKLNPPMTGLRPIDPRTGEAIINPETGKPFSQAEVERLKAAGMTSPLPQASVPLPQAPQAQAPMGQEETRAALGGMTLNEYLNAPSGTEGVSGLRTDPQGRMVPNIGQFQTQPEVAQPPVNSAAPNAVTQPPVGALSSFEKDSLARQQRIGGTGSYEGDSQAMQDRLRADQAMSDRDRRAARGDDISMADQTAMAKANDRNATPREVARGNQVANALGVDLETGQPPEATGAFKPSDILARERFEYDKQQDLIGDDTSDNATTRKIDTIKQANPDISDADAAAIASGSVRVVSNDLTGVTQLLNIATGESRQIESQAAPDVNFDVAVPEQTLFSRAGDFTGFVEATKRKAQGITGQMGLDVATEESLGAAQDFETAQNELVRAFRESSRYAASEAAALKKELNISLSPFEDPKSAEAKLRSIDKSLARRYENEVATFKDTTFPAPERQDSRMRAKAIAEFRANLGVPPEGQGSTSSTQGKVPQGVDPKDWEFMSPEQRNLFN